MAPLEKTGAMYKLLILNHIIAGGLALLVGLLLMSQRKGGRTHVILGWVYTIAMWIVCLSAFSVIAFYRFSFFLMVIGVLTFYSTFLGVRVTRRRKDGYVAWYDWMASVVTFLFGLGLIGYGTFMALTSGVSNLLFVLSSVFGTFIAIGSFKDLEKFYRKDTSNRLWWIREHVSAMGGSYIAGVTALAVQNGDIFMKNSAWTWTLWVLPGVIGGLIITRVIQKMDLKST